MGRKTRKTIQDVKNEVQLTDMRYTGQTTPSDRGLLLATNSRRECEGGGNLPDAGAHDVSTIAGQ